MTRETIIGGGEWRFNDLRDLEPAAPGSPSDPTAYLARSHGYIVQLGS
jgi:hypothetical protein